MGTGEIFSMTTHHIIKSSFDFNKILIIQSLEPHETPTGKINFDFLKDEILQSNRKINVELIECDSKNDFIKILEQLEKNAKLGEKPFIHVECHGSKKEGLEFANGSTLPWELLAEHMRNINIASRFNLTAVFSACFGGYFLKEMNIIKAAPCYAIIAPQDEITPSDCLAVFRIFYRILMETLDMGEAIMKVSEKYFDQGRWFGQLAETWFEYIAMDYLEKQCSNKRARIRAEQIQKEILLSGKKPPSMKAMLEILRKQNSNAIIDGFFNTFYITREIPENKVRFYNVAKRMSSNLNKLRAQGKHII
jgi:hypothetical protein